MIAILQHASKVMLNIIENTIKNKINLNLDADLFGFRAGRGRNKEINPGPACGFGKKSPK